MAGLGLNPRLWHFVLVCGSLPRTHDYKLITTTSLTCPAQVGAQCVSPVRIIRSFVAILAVGSHRVQDPGLLVPEAQDGLCRLLVRSPFGGSFRVVRKPRFEPRKEERAGAAVSRVCLCPVSFFAPKTRF